MKVTVQEKSEENNSVLLADAIGVSKWFKLADRVKMSYVSLGEAEATVDREGEVVTYLKMEKSSGFGSKPKGNTQKSFGSKTEKPEEKKFYKTKHLVLEKLSAEELRTALDIASEQNWVIATQTHFVDGKWNAVIYYKVKPE